MFTLDEYKVSVLLNIKGNLEGIVVMYGHDLQPGSTYLVGARRRFSNSQIISVFVPGRKLISSDETLPDDQLKLLAEKDERVLALQQAYPTEVLPLSDVQRGTAWNNYQSLQSGNLLTPPSDSPGVQAPTTEPAASVSPANTAAESIAPSAPADTSPAPLTDEPVPAAS